MDAIIYQAIHVRLRALTVASGRINGEYVGLHPLAYNPVAMQRRMGRLVPAGVVCFIHHQIIIPLSKRKK